MRITVSDALNFWIEASDLKPKSEYSRLCLLFPHDVSRRVGGLQTHVIIYRLPLYHYKWQHDPYAKKKCFLPSVLLSYLSSKNLQFVNNNHNLNWNVFQFTDCNLNNAITCPFRNHWLKSKHEKTHFKCCSVFWTLRTVSPTRLHALNTANKEWVLNVLYAPKPKQPVSSFCNQLCKCSTQLSPQMQQKRLVTPGWRAMHDYFLESV